MLDICHLLVSTMPIASNRLEELQIKKLIQCVREGDSSQIDKMIELGLPDIVNLQEPDRGYTALHVAVTLNIDNLVTQLLNHGSSTAVQDLQGCTSVMRACEHGHVQTLEALTVKGLSLNITDKAGRTAPFYCLHSTGRHVKCLSLLLQFGADPNTKTVDGIPLICAACETGHDKLVDILLKSGADPNAREVKSGKPAVVIATEAGYKECVQLLAEGKADLNAIYGDNGLCAVHRGASLGHFEVLQVLSAYGADFSLSTTKSDENGAHFATIAYKLLCIRFLGQRGCPTNEANQEGNTPQKIAKNEGMKDAMKELKKLSTFQDKIAKGSKPKGFAEPWSVRLFDWLQCNKQSVYFMLKEGSVNDDGVIQSDVFKELMTQMGAPLSEEEEEKLLKIYDKKGEGSINWDDLLTDHKYVHANYKLGPEDDIKAKKKKGKKKKGGKKGKGKTKIHFPIYFEASRPPLAGVSEGTIEKQIFVTDEQRFPRDSPPPHCYVDDSLWYLIPPDHRYIQIYEAVRHGDTDSLLTAFSEGIETDSRDKYNKTCLMTACAHGRIDIVKLLIDRGASVNAIDNFMWTPLHHACHAGEEDVVRLLIEKGANIDYQSYNGGTPLMRAIETSQRDIVKLLISKGAKLTLANKHGETALEIARNWGDEIIYAIVYAKAASLPSLPEPKGKEKGSEAKGGKGKGDKKGKKEAKGDIGPAVLPGPPLLPPPPSPRLNLPSENLEETRKKSSFKAFQSDVTIKPLPSCQPKPAWVARPLPTKMFQDEQMLSRTERGTESVDFGESKTPFQLQIIARAQALEISDDA